MMYDITNLTISEGHYKDVEVPSMRETFEAQVLIVTAKRVERRYVSPYVMTNGTFPMSEAARVLQSGKFHVELVPSQLVHGKPTLIITEDEASGAHL